VVFPRAGIPYFVVMVLQQFSPARIEDAEPPEPHFLQPELERGDHDPRPVLRPAADASKTKFHELASVEVADLILSDAAHLMQSPPFSFAQGLHTSQGGSAPVGQGSRESPGFA